MNDFVIARYKICQACEHTISAGHGCALRSGCCFGRWRTKPENQCPAGKWPAHSGSAGVSPAISPPRREEPLAPNKETAACPPAQP